MEQSFVDTDGFPAEDWRKDYADIEITYPKIDSSTGASRCSFGQQSPFRPEMYFEVNAVMWVQGDNCEEDSAEISDALADVGGNRHGYPF